MSGLTREEEDFVQWMDGVDLEEVNLLDAPAAAPGADGLGKAPATPAERERLFGEREKLDAPKQRGVGWDES